MLVTVNAVFPLLAIVKVAVLVLPVTTFPKIMLFPSSMIRCAGIPACVTTQVRDSPPPATTTPPVRAAVPAFAAALNVTVPLLVPEAPAVTASHAAFVAAVHATFPVTASVRPLHAALVRPVLAGSTPSAAAAPEP